VSKSIGVLGVAALLLWLQTVVLAVLALLPGTLRSKWYFLPMSAFCGFASGCCLGLMVARLSGPVDAAGQAFSALVFGIGLGLLSLLWVFPFVLLSRLWRRVQWRQRLPAKEQLDA
jgi:hypothetical protein